MRYLHSLSHLPFQPITIGFLPFSFGFIAGHLGTITCFTLVKGDFDLIILIVTNLPWQTQMGSKSSKATCRKMKLIKHVPALINLLKNANNLFSSQMYHTYKDPSSNLVKSNLTWIYLYDQKFCQFDGKHKRQNFIVTKCCTLLSMIILIICFLLLVKLQKKYRKWTRKAHTQKCKLK